MKEYSNTNVTGKVHCTPPAGGPGDNISTYYQQLPIKVKLLRLQVHKFIEKKVSLIESHSFRNNMPVPV